MRSPISAVTGTARTVSTPTEAPRVYIAVASAEHVRVGRAGGFMQVGHGKLAPLRRIRPGDWVVYYSPSVVYGRKDGLQAFTALGQVDAGDLYAFDMGGGFVPFRRNVTWLAGKEVSIAPLLDQLTFTAGVKHWGAKFRFGLFSIPHVDLNIIAGAMGQGFS
jgi:EVE domain